MCADNKFWYKQIMLNKLIQLRLMLSQKLEQL